MKAELVVYVRIGLFMLSGYAVSGGWMPEEAAQHLTHPATVEAVVGLILGAGTLIAYMVSKARKALKNV